MLSADDASSQVSQDAFRRFRETGEEFLRDGKFQDGVTEELETFIGDTSLRTRTSTGMSQSLNKQRLIFETVTDSVFKHRVIHDRGKIKIGMMCDKPL
jgi:hypothetical protein